MTDRKSIWTIRADTITDLKVSFDKDLTKEEALKVFNSGQNYDIIDEDYDIYAILEILD